MKKKFAAFCALRNLPAVGCRLRPDKRRHNDTAGSRSEHGGRRLSDHHRRHVVELFPELSKAEYRTIWIDATTPLVGAENAETATDMLLGMCMAEPYGPEATENTRQTRTACRLTAISWVAWTSL